MRDKRICITKQTTFIGLIFLLLLGYVFFAIRTMSNKTSTNSRASGTSKQAALPEPSISPPFCPLNCIFLVPEIINNEPVKFTGKKPTTLSLTKGVTYGVFRYENSYSPVLGFTSYIGKDTIENNDLTSEVRIQTSLVTPSNISKYYVLYNMSAPTTLTQPDISQNCKQYIMQCDNYPAPTIAAPRAD